MPLKRHPSQPLGLLSTTRVLLVEDDREDAALCARLLADTGRDWFTISVAASYEEGLEAMTSDAFDVYLVDLALGPRCGLDLIEHATACGCHGPKVVLTGVSDEGLDARALASGAVDFLEKNVLTATALRRSITYAVERHRLVRVLEEQARSLAQSQESFRVLAQNADGLVVVSGDGLILYANPAAGALFGSPAGALRGHPFGYETSGGMVDLDLRTAAGERRRVQARFVAVRWQGEPATLASLRDVTDIRDAEARLLQSQKMNVVGRLAGSVAHDFNNLLAGIVGHLDVASLEGTSPESCRRSIEEAIRAVERASQLTRGLLDFARQRERAREVVPLHGSVARILPLLRQLGGPRLEVVAEFGEGDPYVQIDHGEVEQVLLNLLTNARDAMDGAGIVRIEVGVREVAETPDDALALPSPPRPGAWAAIRVADAGCGMTPALLRSAFDPFVTTKESGRGTGLGLAIVYDIVQQAGGHIVVWSRPEGGTTLDVLLPVAAATRAEAKKAREVLGVPGTKRRYRVLVVDDERSLCSVVRSALESAGHVAIVAGDGMEALRICQERRPELDLLLTDIAMPGMDGFELAEAVTGLFPGLPVLYMSGYGDDAAARRGLDPASVRIVPKPFRIVTLLEEVRAIVEGAPPEG